MNSQSSKTSANVPPDSGPVKPRIDWRKARRRALIVAIAAFILLLIIFFLFPVWISNDQGRAYVLGRFNQRLLNAGGKPAATLAVGEWSLSWFHPTELKNVRITLDDGKVLLACAHVKSGLTLWDIVWGIHDVGTTTVDDLRTNITLRAAGGSSLDALATPALRQWLSSLRGSVHVTGGEAVVASERTGQWVQFTTLQGTLTVAPETLVHLQLLASGSGKAGPLASALTSELALNATFPAIRTADFKDPSAWWAMLTDVELTSSNTPTALACECLAQDPAWAQALGSELSSVRFSNHAAPREPGRPVLVLRGSGDGQADTALDVRLLFRAPAPATKTQAAIDGFIALPATAAGATGANGNTGGEEFHATATLRMAPKLMNALKRVNPFLGELQAADSGLLALSLSALNVPLPAISGANTAARDALAQGRITFPELTIPMDGPIFKQMQSRLPAMTDWPARVPGSASNLRAALADANWSCENFILTADRIPLILSGNTNLDGQTHLLAEIPLATTGLTAQKAQIVITGTVDDPQVLSAK